ncbi:hypothetical protein [Polyangium sp. y55x31]|uniref:hypothetical protein n=1 Tax=Polyangium sp. y55x31 TaxID=3042688 RepID=UPI002482C7B8|nr:hypothetical protein [Polyangium sp. y55x31]MDI1483683.1 hypothetical protein [Polyangium sp. y55x31]
MRSFSKRHLSAALAGALFALATPATARPDEPAPATARPDEPAPAAARPDEPAPSPAPEDTAIAIEEKPPAPAPATRPATRPAPPAPKDPPPPPARSSTVPYSLAVFGLGAAFIVAGGVMMGVAETSDERCGVAGCYGVLDPQLDFAGRLLLAGGIGMGIGSGVAVLVGLGTDGRPGPRRSDQLTEMGIFATALGAGLGGVSLASAMADEYKLEGLPDPFASRALALALVSTAAGMGFWIYGARSAPTSTAASLRVGPTSAQFTVRY